ncbi:MAG: hypothetical protein ACYC0K_05310, partial [Thermoleophilia bacterium]
QHGYDTFITLGTGTHNVCAYGINKAGTAGTNVTLGCQAITVNNSTYGNLEAVTRVGSNLRAQGWSFDWDSASSIEVRFYVNSVYKSSVTANLNRSDLGTAYPAYGPLHGYDATFGTIGSGAQTVCAYGINIAGTAGDNTTLGCRTVP